MLLVTGATGTIGRPLLRRLLSTGVPVRVLARDPARLGGLRGDVEVAIGDLADAEGFDRVLDGVETVVHLAAALRDQPRGSIEDLTVTATGRLVAAAERSGVRRLVFFSILQASDHSPSRLVRAKAAAERAVVGSSVPHTVFALGWVYARDDPFMALTGRMSRLPVMVISGSGAARFEPIWAEDVADCVMAALPGGAHGDASERSRYELAGPQTLSYQEIVATVLAAWHRPRPFVRVPLALVRPGLRLGERLLGARAPATWEEAQLLELTLLSARGTADAESLGVVPRTMARALVGGP